MGETHNKIIAATAKVEIGLLGFRRKGRSRLWLADHGSWLNVVEFTPSRWSKGVSLMNAVHWLWAGHGFLSLNLAIPSKFHAEFETEDQFGNAATNIAREAATKALELEKTFSSFEATAKFVVDRARGSDRMRPSWWGYQAGMASGMQNSFDDAEWFLRGVSDQRVTVHAAALLPLIDRPANFRSKVNELVARQRAALKLPALDRHPFDVRI